MMRIHVTNKRPAGRRTKGWYFTVKARNGKKVATSETYSSKSKAVQSARTLAENECTVTIEE